MNNWLGAIGKDSNLLTLTDLLQNPTVLCWVKRHVVRLKGYDTGSTYIQKADCHKVQTIEYISSREYKHIVPAFTLESSTSSY